MEMLMAFIAFLLLLVCALSAIKILWNIFVAKKEITPSLSKTFYASLGAGNVLLDLAVAILESNYPMFFAGLAVAAFMFLVVFALQMIYQKIRRGAVDSPLKKYAAISFVTMILSYPVGAATEPSSLVEGRLIKEAQREAEKEVALREKAEAKAKAEAAEKEKAELAKAEAEKAKAEAEIAKAEAEKAKAETEKLRLAAEKEKAEKAAAEQKAAEAKQEELKKEQAKNTPAEEVKEKPRNTLLPDSSNENDDGGIWGSIKSYVGEKISGAKEYAGGLISNEVHAYDWQPKDGGNVISYYFVPSSKKRKDAGLIFKDEGYTVEVVAKSGDKIIVVKDYWFVEKSDGWKWTDNDGGDWYAIKNNYSDFEKILGLEKGKAIFESSKHLPNLGVVN